MSMGYMEGDETHPIDIVEVIAEYHNWDFDRITDDQIAMAIEGQWRAYSITLAWSGYDTTLRLICTFELDPPEEKLSALYETLNLVNDQVWTGAFTFWNEQRLIVWRYGLSLAGEQIASQEQIDGMISNPMVSAEQFYPAFQLACWGDQSPEEAIGAAIAGAYGRA